MRRESRARATRADTRRERCGDNVGTGRRRGGRGETARARAARHASARPRAAGLGPRPARGGWARPVGPRRRPARLESAPEPTAKPTAEPNADRYAIDAKRREYRADSEAAAREASEADARPKPPQRESNRGTRGPRGRNETTPRTARPRREKHHKKNHAQVLDIHGRQKQQKRTSTFFEFCRATSGVLLCTDVAARGLDIPEVNWIVQFDPPV